MNHSRPILAFAPRRDFMTSSNTLAGTLGLLIPVALVLGAVLNVGAQNTGGLSTQLNSSVAISDFDGDLWPDVAVVQLGRSYASAADYWILVRLSTAASQAIRIVATAGGLQIAARDVNGDRITDIVLTTKGSGQPVAILLNDGHGTFTRVDPQAYPDTPGRANTNWSSEPVQQHTLAVSSHSLSAARFSSARLPHLKCCARHRLSDGIFLVALDSHSHLSRAPPLNLAHLKNEEATFSGCGDSELPEGAHMNCNSCGSGRLRRFSAEIAIHFCGLKNIDKPTVYVCSEVAVCLDCGASQFVVPETQLIQLDEDHAGTAG